MASATRNTKTNNSINTDNFVDSIVSVNGLVEVNQGGKSVPHVVLTGAIMLRDVFEKIDSFMIRDEKKILKTSDRYINSDENSILVEAMAIEDNNKASFLVLLSRREDGLVIRIYPDSNVEKTEGIKKILAKIAKQLLEKFPNLRIGKTNLQDFL